MDIVTSSLPFRISYKNITDGKDRYFCIVGNDTPEIRKEKLRDRLHKHEYYELVYVLKGEMTQHLENGVFHYHQGDACLLNRNTRHYEGHETDCTLLFLNFAPDFLRKLFGENDILPDTRQFTPGIIQEFLLQNMQSDQELTREYLDFARNSGEAPRDASRIPELLDRMILELLYPGTGFAFRIQADLLSLIAALENPACYTASRIRIGPGSEAFLMARMNGFIEFRHGRTSREELSAVFHYSGDYLNRIARHQTGMTISQLCQYACLREAKRLLQQTDRSISDIIEELGYVNRTYFYKIFKKQFGLSPLELRNAVKHRTQNRELS